MRGNKEPMGEPPTPPGSAAPKGIPRGRGPYLACKWLKTHEMRTFPASYFPAMPEDGLLPGGQARLGRILSGHGISRRGRGNFPGCKALKIHEMRKLSPSSLLAKREN